MRAMMGSLLAALISLTSCQDPIKTVLIRGQVVDAAGKAVAKADVAARWNYYDSNPEEGATTTNQEGRYSIEVPVGTGPTPPEVSLMAMDRERKRGGIVVLKEKEFDKSATITLGALVTVRGRLDPGEIKPDPRDTQVQMERERDHVLVVSSAWRSADLAVKLPPGKYQLWVVGPRLQHKVEGIDLTGEKPEVDLGTMKLTILKRSD